MKYLLILSLALTTQAIFFNLEGGKEFCIYEYIEQGESLEGAWSVSGRGEKNVRVSVMSPSRDLEYVSSHGVREEQIKLKARIAGKHELCFKSTDDQQKLFSFELMSEDLNQLVREDHVDPILQQFQSLIKQFQSVYRNQRFYSRRERVHRNISEKTNDRVVFCSFIKMIVLIVMAFLQVYVLKSFFNVKKGVKI